MRNNYEKEPNLPNWYGNYDTYPDMYKQLGLHFCEIPVKQHASGAAIDDCFEDVDGYLFVSNGEYGSQVNYCPMCGYEAKKKDE